MKMQKAKLRYIKCIEQDDFWDIGDDSPYFFYATDGSALTKQGPWDLNEGESKTLDRVYTFENSLWIKPRESDGGKTKDETGGSLFFGQKKYLPKHAAHFLELPVKVKTEKSFVAKVGDGKFEYAFTFLPPGEEF